MVSKKPSIGRQKIAMRKIPKKNNLQVTFSKRRAGLFKKASELCTLCGVEIAIVVFSPAKKSYSFGHPNVESLIDHYMTKNLPPMVSNDTHKLIEAHRNANIQELNTQITQILDQLEVEKKNREALDKMKKANQNQCWWQAPIDGLGLLELHRLRVAMEELKKNIAAIQVNRILQESTNPSPFVYGGNGHFSHHGNIHGNIPNGVDVASVIPHVNNFGYGQRHY
ncbi:SRF-TF domain-containing protein [Cephalotus follicularis]|uniref:SRF-TF domain-containing protein n=1 Tax=Cephalotus follicularis TaxID=3775 RepID=A0A1Q3CJL0_CEPFO|nr:SRF-TF domain-containing protein [Cephalotus follicularis]